MEHQRKDANIIFASLFIQTAGCEQTEYWKNKIHIEDVWKETYGNENIIVGIIDSGIDITSSDLQSVIYHNDQEISNNQVDDVVNAIKYGYNKGIRLFNCSWDMEVYSEKLYTIMKECSDAIFVCSGGKNSSNVDVQHVYPACFELPNAICVGGLGINGKIYEFSGYGEKIDIYAPAEKVYCLMPEDTYTYSEGVSISVAYVTGTIALAKSINPTLKCEEIKNRLHKCYNDELNIPVLDVKKICIQE